MLKKITSVIICVLLILPFAVMCVSAVEPEFDTYEYGYVDKLDLPEDGMPVSAQPAKTAPAKRGVSSPDEPYTFYSTLTSDMQRYIYNGLAGAHGGLDNMVDSSSDQLQISITSDDGSWDFTDQAGLNALANSAFDALSMSLMCFAEDHPQYFWIGGYGASFSYTSSGGKYRGILIVKLNLKTTAYATWGVVRNYYYTLMDWVENFKVTGNTRYQKIKSIHDQICMAVAYDTDFNNPTAHEPVSVCTSPYEPVCEGYAEAFKLICDREEIPCITVIGTASGGGHKWNYVRMDDGKFYGMDVTWDDQSNIYYDYFLSGKQTNCFFFSGGTFEDKHTPTGQFFSGGDSLTYPDFNDVSYVAALLNPDSKATFDAVNGRMFISKEANLNQQFVAKVYSGADHTVSITGTTTGATVTTTTGSTTKIFTVSRWGDVDANNAVNTTDYNTMKAVVAGTGTIADNTPNEWAADFDGDDTIDAFDLYYMDMYLNGNIDF